MAIWVILIWVFRLVDESGSSKLTGIINKSKATVIFNQIRMKIGVMFGNPETSTGGNALKFYASP